MLLPVYTLLTITSINIILLIWKILTSFFICDVSVIKKIHVDFLHFENDYDWSFVVQSDHAKM